QLRKQRAPVHNCTAVLWHLPHNTHMKTKIIGSEKMGGGHGAASGQSRDGTATELVKSADVLGRRFVRILAGVDGASAIEEVLSEDFVAYLPYIRHAVHGKEKFEAQMKEFRSALDRKSTRLNSSHLIISYAVFCLKKKNRKVQSDVKPIHRDRGLDRIHATQSQRAHNIARVHWGFKHPDEGISVFIDGRFRSASGQ